MTDDLIKIEYNTVSSKKIISGMTFNETEYQAKIHHSGLNVHQEVSNNSKPVLDHIVTSTIAQLTKNYIIHLKCKIQEEKENQRLIKVDRSNFVNTLSDNAIKLIKDTEDILHYGVRAKAKFHWEKLKKYEQFNEPNPQSEFIEPDFKKELLLLKSQMTSPTRPTYKEHPPQPLKDEFAPKSKLLETIIPSRKRARIEEENTFYQKMLTFWEDKCQTFDEINRVEKDKYEKSIAEFEKQQIKIEDDIENKKNEFNNELSIRLEEWKKRKSNHEDAQTLMHKSIDDKKENYLKGEPTAIIDYYNEVLNFSKYPISFLKSFDLEYSPDNKILIVDYSLPNIDEIPTLTQVKVIKEEVKEYHLSEVNAEKLFDVTMYNITLRTIYEIFDSDAINVIDAVSFNGWVKAINKATGNKENNCILSIQVRKGDFKDVDLLNVDPKACFKAFKGVGSSKLSGLTPIRPIIKIDRTDKRFTNHYEVAGAIDDSTNLASMDWEDFEHLIREVFAQEFSSNGGEVRVTQASRDGGVDAIAFDPDPIRGGKIVIQAKRYSNTVGVSAVRDLYGTVLNEGATKGILVTTADLWPDAYAFVKGKPLTLMNGANLLYLLEKHGHRAKIDLKEAKLMNKNMQ